MTFPEFKGTKGEWMLPHFANDESTCDCGFVLNEGYFGAIATVHYSKNGTMEEGDNPLLEEAIANANLISAAPYLLKALQLALSTPHNEWDIEKQQICFDALEKALGAPIINPRPEGTPDAF